MIFKKSAKQRGMLDSLKVTGLIRVKSYRKRITHFTHAIVAFTKGGQNLSCGTQTFAL